MTVPPRSSPSSWGAYCGAVLLACAAFAALYPEPLDFLRGRGVYFETGDAIQHVSGWLLFAKDQWRWPLLMTRLLNAPVGASIALTDSIPLAALPFKLIHPLLPENFHYFGLWHLLTKIGSAVGATYLIRSLGRSDVFSGLVAAIFALLWPAALARIDHTSLATNGVLLVALGIYFRAFADQWSLTSTVGAFGVLSIAALLVHPYLFAMVFPLFLAWIADHVVRTGRVLAALGALVVGGSGAIFAAVLLGYEQGSLTAAPGYNHLSMNLLSPVCGGALIPCQAWDATGGQREGYNYFGLGALAVVLVGGLASMTKMPDGLKQQPALFLVLAGFTIYSLSNTVFFGSQVVASYALPPGFLQLSEIFRASGRFFWVTAYALFFLALAQLLRKRSRATPLFLLAALLLQWMDTAVLRAAIVERTTMARPFAYKGWGRYSGEIKHVKISPPYGCAPDIENMRYLYFQMVAGRLGASINTGYLARPSSDCAAFTDASLGGPDTLHAFLQPVAGLPFPKVLADGLANGDCALWAAWNGIALCRRGGKSMNWQVLFERPTE